MVSPRKDALDTDKIGSLLFKLTVPTVMAQLVSLLYNVVDRIFIGHIPEVGAMALTGVGITFPIIVLILAFTDLIGFGGAPKASIEMGRQNNDMAERILGNCFCNLILVSLILTFGIYGGLEPLLRMFGASNETLPYALDYLSIYLLGTIFIQVGIGLNNFISAQGYAKISMITVMVGAIVNIILDPIFIFGLDLGVKGAAIATVIAQGISAVWVLSFLAGKSTKWRIRKKYFRIEKKIMLSVLSLGMAPFVMKSTESLLTISFNISLQKYGGDLAVGAMTILATIKQMAFLPMTGICRGAQPIIGYNYGALNFVRIKRTFKLVLISSLILSTICWVLVMIKPDPVIALFTNDQGLIEKTVWAAKIYFFSLFILGVQMACQQTFIALGQAREGLLMAILRKIVLLIPFIYIFPCFIENKVFAVFLAEPVADIMATCVTMLVFRWRTKKILG